MRPLPLLRDFAIVYALTFLAGLIIGFTWAFFRLDPRLYFLAMGAANLAFGCVGFLIAGLLTRSGRWRHLLQVGLVLWLFSLTNLLFGVTLVQWLLSAIFILMMLGVGGGGATLISPETAKDPDAV